MQGIMFNGVLASTTLATTLAFSNPAIARRIARLLNSSRPNRGRTRAAGQSDRSRLIALALFALLLLGIAAINCAAMGGVYDITADAPGLI